MTEEGEETGSRGEVRVGCSGWDYRGWRGAVYPSDLDPSQWFAHYCTLFDTVEVNNTFYRLPSMGTVGRWADQAPPGFVYSLKLGQFGSHRKKLRDATSWLPNHVARLRRLGLKAGPTLVQLPPRWRADAERLDEFLAAAPADLRWAVELRDPSWLVDGVFDVLSHHGAALCIHDLLADHPWIRTTSWTYVRFHGPHARTDAYVGAYTGRRLRGAAERLAAWADEGTDVYAYFNNDEEGHAVSDARWLRGRLPAARRPPG